ncbi:EAL domain-containing protein [Dyella japonica]|uniref:EAL domain-containing protein (Putative c-di-GMP-specific phosphodiesterase class I) n=1 Tax=Dyella japonica TaxID=231455 RepID=A0ABV2K154_9GAMM
MNAYSSDMSACLTSILGEGRLVAYFQPKFTLCGRLIGVEALARWRIHDGRIVPPGDFLPAVAELGLMRHLTVEMMSQATDAVASWQRNQGKQLTVSINLTPGCIVDPSVLDQLRRMSANHGISPQQVVIEVLEDALDQPAEEFLLALDNFRRRGFRISIDDFGTGSAGLRRLIDFDAHEIKIPGYFTQGVKADQRKADLILCIISLAEQLNMDTVLEGIQDQEDLAWLKRIRSSRVLVQGFALGHPMSVEHFLRVEPLAA